MGSVIVHNTNGYNLAALDSQLMHSHAHSHAYIHTFSNNRALSPLVNLIHRPSMLLGSMLLGSTELQEALLPEQLEQILGESRGSDTRAPYHSPGPEPLQLESPRSGRIPTIKTESNPSVGKTLGGSQCKDGIGGAAEVRMTPLPASRGVPAAARNEMLAGSRAPSAPKCVPP